MDIRKFPAALTMGFVGFAGLMTGAAVLIHLASYGPDEIGPTLMNLALALSPIIFLVFGPAVFVVSVARIPFERVFGGLPIYIYVAAAVLLLYVAVDFLLMVQMLPGQPEQDGSNYYMSSGGTLTPITAVAYRMALMHSARLISGHELYFFALATLIGYQLEGIRRGRISINVAPRDQAMERSPLPYPLSKVVGLRTTLPSEACAARLMARVPRPAWSFFATAQSLRGEASALEFRVEMASSQSQLVYAVGRFGRVGADTGIRVLLLFKRWPLIGFAATIVVAPLIWAFMTASGFPVPWPWLVAVFVVGVGGNLLYGLDQRRRLLAQIKLATEATEIPPNDPEFALLS